jgi:hypothetical protein
VDEQYMHDLKDRSLNCKIDAVLLAFKAIAVIATPFAAATCIPALLLQ